MDPVTGALIMAGVSGLGKMFGMGGERKRRKAAEAEGRRQFDARHALDVAANNRQQGEYDARVRSRQATNPQREAIAAKLFQKLVGGNLPMMGGGMPPTAGPPPMPAGVMMGGGGGGGMGMGGGSPLDDIFRQFQP